MWIVCAFLGLLCIVQASVIARDTRESSAAATFAAADDRSSLIPVTIAAIPLLLPMLTKFALSVSISGIAYVAMLITWMFSNGMHALTRSLEMVDEEDSKLSHAASAFRRAMSTVEETVTGGTPDCRRRIVCEVSRAVSTAVPKEFQPEGFVMAYLTNQSSHHESYTGAWACGWLKQDCVETFVCDRYSVDRVSTVFRSMGGSHGYISHLLNRVTNATVDLVQSSTVSALSTTRAPTIVHHMVSSMLTSADDSTEDFGTRFGLW